MGGEKKMAVRMIALDLDRTTLDYQGRLSDGNRRTLQEALDRGIVVVPASGRPLSSFPGEILKLRGLKYLITSNGAAVYLKNGKEESIQSHTQQQPDETCIRRFLLEPSAVHRIMELTEEAGVTYETFVQGKAYADEAYVREPTAFGALPPAVPYIRSTRMPVRDIRAFLKEHADKLDSIDVIVGNQQKKRKLMERIRRECPGIYLTTSVEQLIEISDQRSGKHSAVRFLRERLGIGREETAAFGDGDNDAEMLREAGIGIAVSNATQKCREAADRITESCDNDGVAHAVRRILDGTHPENQG